MFDVANRRKTPKRFTLLLLEEEEDYVADYVGTCRWGLPSCRSLV
jgi:hypothetical protein